MTQRLDCVSRWAELLVTSAENDKVAQKSNRYKLIKVLMASITTGVDCSYLSKFGSIVLRV